uniref:putative F-box protein At5g50220 isoform X2 n=1 Tax=Fragaria vesca subsp. vesca TaxID=101020 RepID=UPI0005C86EE5|nr:PREDICTED: putative F-box protein At5g50220 isoform X2 [Fragaria vesca subsp. vesca]
MTSTSSAAVMEKRTAAMSSSKLMELPYEILLLIFSKLPARSILQFQCVSKSSRNLVNNPALAAMHMAATNEHIDVEVRSLPFSYKNHLRFVSCGLLGFKYFGQVDGKLGLYNPLRREYLWLPQPEYIHDMFSERYGMGFDSVTNSHKIVHFLSRGFPERPNRWVARVHVLGTGSWRRIPLCSFTTVEVGNAYAYGEMHWLVDGNQIMSFNFREEEFRWTINPPPVTFRSSFARHFLINLRGSLALVDVVYSEKKVEIWMYKEQKYWTKDYCMPLDCCSGGYSNFAVGAWEHGIYIIIYEDYCIDQSLKYPTVVYYDLRCDNKKEHCRYQEQLHLFSSTGSLISLKQYDNVRTNSEKNFFDAGECDFPECVSELLKAPRVK